MATTRFAAPWDGGVKLATAVTLVLVGGAGVLVVATVGPGLFARYHHPATWLVPFVVLFVPAILLFAAARDAPLGYAVDETGVRIDRRAGPVAIPFSSIRAVRAVPAGTSFSRLVGSGGFLGYFGQFRNPELGAVRMYATRGDGRVLLETNAGTFVLTPEDPSRFVAAVKARS